MVKNKFVKIFRHRGHTFEIKVFLLNKNTRELGGVSMHLITLTDVSNDIRAEVKRYDIAPTVLFDQALIYSIVTDARVWADEFDGLTKSKEQEALEELGFTAVD